MEFKGWIEVVEWPGEVGGNSCVISWETLSALLCVEAAVGDQDLEVSCLVKWEGQC